MSANSKLFLFVHFLVVLQLSHSLRCFVCNSLKLSPHIPCPGAELMEDSNGTEACRFLGLSDGTVISQSPVTIELCSPIAFQTIQIQMANDFQDGEGITSCCTWDGCNGEASKATRSKEEYEKYLLEKTQKLEKFNSDLASDKAQKVAAFSDRIAPTYFPTLSTEKQGIELKPIPFLTEGGKLFNKNTKNKPEKDGELFVYQSGEDSTEFMVFVTQKQGFEPKPTTVETTIDILAIPDASEGTEENRERTFLQIPRNKFGATITAKDFFPFEGFNQGKHNHHPKRPEESGEAFNTGMENLKRNRWKTTENEDKNEKYFEETTREIENEKLNEETLTLQETEDTSKYPIQSSTTSRPTEKHTDQIEESHIITETKTEEIEKETEPKTHRTSTVTEIQQTEEAKVETSPDIQETSPAIEISGEPDKSTKGTNVDTQYTSHALGSEIDDKTDKSAKVTIEDTQEINKAIDGEPNKSSKVTSEDAPDTSQATSSEIISNPENTKFISEDTSQIIKVGQDDEVKNSSKLTINATSDSSPFINSEIGSDGHSHELSSIAMPDTSPFISKELDGEPDKSTRTNSEIINDDLSETSKATEMQTEKTEKSTTIKVTTKRKEVSMKDLLITRKIKIEQSSEAPMDNVAVTATKIVQNLSESSLDGEPVKGSSGTSLETSETKLEVGHGTEPSLANLEPIIGHPGEEDKSVETFQSENSKLVEEEIVNAEEILGFPTNSSFTHPQGNLGNSESHTSEDLSPEADKQLTQTKTTEMTQTQEENKETQSSKTESSKSHQSEMESSKTLSLEEDILEAVTNEAQSTRINSVQAQVGEHDKTLTNEHLIDQTDGDTSTTKLESLESQSNPPDDSLKSEVDKLENTKIVSMVTISHQTQTSPESQASEANYSQPHTIKTDTTVTQNGKTEILNTQNIGIEATQTQSSEIDLQQSPQVGELDKTNVLNSHTGESQTLSSETEGLKAQNGEIDLHNEATHSGIQTTSSSEIKTDAEELSNENGAMIQMAQTKPTYKPTVIETKPTGKTTIDSWLTATTLVTFKQGIEYRLGPKNEFSHFNSDGRVGYKSQYIETETENLAEVTHNPKSTAPLEHLHSEQPKIPKTYMGNGRKQVTGRPKPNIDLFLQEGPPYQPDQNFHDENDLDPFLESDLDGVDSIPVQVQSKPEEDTEENPYLISAGFSNLLGKLNPRPPGNKVVEKFSGGDPGFPESSTINPESQEPLTQYFLNRESKNLAVSKNHFNNLVQVIFSLLLHVYVMLHQNMD